MFHRNVMLLVFFYFQDLFFVAFRYINGKTVNSQSGQGIGLRKCEDVIKEFKSIQRSDRFNYRFAV